MAQEKTPDYRQALVIHWSELHALFMLGGTALALPLSEPGILVVLAAGSFSTLIWSCRRRWSPAGRFGRANAVTAVRLLGILALPKIAHLDYLAVAACGVALCALDAVDGWLARRLELSSEFGEYFDKETDALFTLMLCLLLYLGGRLEGWILLPGLLRYGFVVFLMLAKPPAAKERQSPKSKWISIAMISALIAACTPFPALYEPYAMLTTLMLLYSFADSIVNLYRPPRVGPRALKMPRLKTRQVQSAEEIRAFFDALADDYRDSHGDGESALQHRLALIRRLLAGVERSLLVEIGCGNGLHLFPLSGEFAATVGTDLSPKMIAAAEVVRSGHIHGAHIRLVAEPAERLTSVTSGSADAVLCVGAFEHMQDWEAVLAEVTRVLRQGGAFICLSPNGNYLWYTHLAPWLGFATRHLSTDRFLSRNEWRRLARVCGLTPVTIGYWCFVPAADMPRWAAHVMSGLDLIGRGLGISGLRGGCYVKAVKS